MLNYVVTGPALAAVVLIGMAVAALVVVMVLGIFCIHASHQQRSKVELTEGETKTVCNDAAVTITVNPMEASQLIHFT